jgi:glutathione S-transferase
MEIEVMSSENLKLYESAGSPNSRRVRIFLAEKRISVARVAVDLGAKEQFSDAYSRINPRRVVPTLVLADGTAIGEVPAIFRYLEETHPASPLFGTSPKDRALVTMWERRMELEGFAAVMETVRNAAAGLKGRAIAGTHDYEQIPALVERGRQRVTDFYADLEARLADVPFVAGDQFSAADITAIVAIDFAGKALNLPIPESHEASKRWYAAVAARPNMSA